MLSSIRESEEGDESSAASNVNEISTLCSKSLVDLSERLTSDLEAKTDTSMDKISNHIWHCDIDNGTGLASDLLKNDIEVEVSQRLDNECSSESCLIDGNTDEKQSCNPCIEASVTVETEVDVEIPLNAADSESVELVEFDTVDSNLGVAFGDWRAHWDEHYMRTFFYNTVTQESTWDPPPEVEVNLVDDALLNVTFTESNSCSYDGSIVKKEKKTTKKGQIFFPLLHLTLSSGGYIPSIRSYIS